MSIAARLAALGLELPAPPPPAGLYQPYVVDQGLVYLSGVAPRDGDSYAFVGDVGGALSVEQGRQAARLCALGLLSNLALACGGDLDRVRRFISLRGYVTVAPGFIDVPLVTNGASELILDVFGQAAGAHARTSIGCASLPGGVAVELDAVVALR